jgi:hypothetical protein
MEGLKARPQQTVICQRIQAEKVLAARAMRANLSAAEALLWKQRCNLPRQALLGLLPLLSGEGRLRKHPREPNQG